MEKAGFRQTKNENLEPRFNYINHFFSMKIIYALLILSFVFSACSKISRDRLEGAWKVVSIKELPNDANKFWTNMLDTSEVDVLFFATGELKTFLKQGDTLSGFFNGTYELKEDEREILIDDENLIFNSQGKTLKINLLRRNKMQFEGRFYLQMIEPTASPDSFLTVEWNFEK